MSSVNTISSVFMSTGQENLPIVNVFNETDLNIKNALVSRVNGITNDSIRTITSDNALLNRVTGILVTRNIGRFDLGVSQISNLIGTTEIGSKIKGLTGTLSDTFKGALSGALSAIHIDPKSALGAVSVIGGEVSYLAQSAIGLGTEAGTFLNKAVNSLGLGKIINMDYEYAVLQAAISDMVRYGATEAVDNLIYGYQIDYDNDNIGYIGQIIIKKAIKNSLPDLVKQGKLSSIKNFLQKLGPGEAVERYPGVAQDILEYYQMPKNTKINDYKAQLTLLEEVLDLANPEWYKTKKIFSEYVRVEDPDTGETDVVIQNRVVERYNLHTFLNYGPDAKSVMAIEDNHKYRVQLTIAKKYNDSTNGITAFLRSQFPNAVLSSETRAA